MPSLRNSKSAPPQAMTWAKATPVLAVAVIFDALRFISGQFWFFGPAFAAVYCTAKASAVTGGGAVAIKVSGMFCGAAAGVAGSLGSPFFAAFGIVLAMTLGLMGWLTIVLWLLVTNARLLKENISWFGGSLVLSEVPILGSLPALTTTVIKMYHTQIKNDKKALKKYATESAAAELQDRRQKAAELMQAQNMQAMQEEEADNEAESAEEIPDELRKAA